MNTYFVGSRLKLENDFEPHVCQDVSRTAEDFRAICPVGPWITVASLLATVTGLLVSPYFPGAHGRHDMCFMDLASIHQTDTRPWSIYRSFQGCMEPGRRMLSGFRAGTSVFFYAGTILPACPVESGMKLHGGLRAWSLTDVRPCNVKALVLTILVSWRSWYYSAVWDPGRDPYLRASYTILCGVGVSFPTLLIDMDAQNLAPSRVSNPTAGPDCPHFLTEGAEVVPLQSPKSAPFGASFQKALKDPMSMAVSINWWSISWVSL